MTKAAQKKAGRKKTVARKASTLTKKRATAKPARVPEKKGVAAKKRVVAAKKTTSASAPKTAGPTDTGGKLSFNHAMIYLKDVRRGLEFYRDWLGFKVIEDFRHEGKSVYARLRAPDGDGTIALHQAGPGASVASDGVRLYFEVPNLDEFCAKLRRRGFYLTQQPQMMPWGWRHAYLNDPEGHEISLYWAGELRMKKSVMQAAQRAETR
jgi:catechol 2,3-dioxygenase-like lactoylglutathione lyase family enzyme